MRNFASTLVKFSKLSHIQTTIWRPPKMAPPRTAGSAGPFVTPLEGARYSVDRRWGFTVHRKHGGKNGGTVFGGHGILGADFGGFY